MAPWLKKVEMLRAGEETTKRPREAMAVRLRMKVVLRGVLRVIILSGIFFIFCFGLFVRPQFACFGTGRWWL